MLQQRQRNKSIGYTGVTANHSVVTTDKTSTKRVRSDGDCALREAIEEREDEGQAVKVTEIEEGQEEEVQGGGDRSDKEARGRDRSGSVAVP